MSNNAEHTFTQALVFMVLSTTTEGWQAAFFLVAAVGFLVLGWFQR